MKINTPKEKYIFIELNKSDMKKLNLSYADMDYSDEQTRRTIFSVLDQARYSLGQDFKLSDTMKVEALPRDDGGCLLFFTIGEKIKKYRLYSRTSEVTYVFEDLNELLDLSSSFSCRKAGEIESSLYYSYDRYFLKLRGKLRHSLIMIMNEFSQHIEKKEIPLFSENECLIAENALEVLCGGVSE